MKNPVELHRIFNPSGCLTQEAIDLYVAAKSTAEVTRQIEDHLTECPFCSDAVEGYMDMENAGRSRAILDETRAKLFGEKETPVIGLAAVPVTRTRTSSKVIYWGIAATILVLGVSYFVVRFILPSPSGEEISVYDKKVAPAEKTPETRTDVPRAERSADAKGPEEKEELQKDGFIMPGIVFGDNIATGGTGVEESAGDRYSVEPTKEANSLIVDDLTFFREDGAGYEPSKDKDVSEDKEQRDEGNIEMDQTVTVTEVTTSGNDRSLGVVGGNKKSNESKAPTSVSGEVQQQMNDGMNAYNSGDYPGAAEKFESALEESPDQDQALYYNGMSYYYTATYDKALQLFEKILKKKNSPYYQAAQWQIAQIYVQKGENKQARKTLNEVIDMNGTYRSEAEKQIDQLPE